MNRAFVPIVILRESSLADYRKRVELEAQRRKAEQADTEPPKKEPPPDEPA